MPPRRRLVVGCRGVPADAGLEEIERALMRRKVDSDESSVRDDHFVCSPRGSSIERGVAAQDVTRLLVEEVHATHFGQEAARKDVRFACVQKPAAGGERLRRLIVDADGRDRHVSALHADHGDQQLDTDTGMCCLEDGRGEFRRERDGPAADLVGRDAEDRCGKPLGEMRGGEVGHRTVTTAADGDWFRG